MWRSEGQQEGKEKEKGQKQKKEDGAGKYMRLKIWFRAPMLVTGNGSSPFSSTSSDWCRRHMAIQLAALAVAIQAHRITWWQIHSTFFSSFSQHPLDLTIFFFILDFLDFRCCRWLCLSKVTVPLLSRVDFNSYFPLTFELVCLADKDMLHPPPLEHCFIEFMSKFQFQLPVILLISSTRSYNWYSNI